MHNKLRYQAKIHAISEKLSREKIKFSTSSPQFFIIIILYGKQQKHSSMVKKIKLNLACVARSNLSSRRKVQNYQYRKVAD
jgi:hypothetical protein